MKRQPIIVTILQTELRCLFCLLLFSHRSHHTYQEESSLTYICHFTLRQQMYIILATGQSTSNLVEMCHWHSFRLRPPTMPSMELPWAAVFDTKHMISDTLPSGMLPFIGNHTSNNYKYNILRIIMVAPFLSFDARSLCCKSQTGPRDQACKFMQGSETRR